jgi:hypothetical protein
MCKTVKIVFPIDVFKDRIEERVNELQPEFDWRECTSYHNRNKYRQATICGLIGYKHGKYTNYYVGIIRTNCGAHIRFWFLGEPNLCRESFKVRRNRAGVDEVAKRIIDTYKIISIMEQ